MLKRWSIGSVVIALVILMVVPAASAGKHGTDRPFKASFAGEVHWEFPGDFASDCVEMTTVSDSFGTATHMGQTEYLSSHCPLESDNSDDGRFTMVAANGDGLHGTYDYDPASESFDVEIAFDGGTGRFAKAVGHGTMTYSIVPVFLPDCNPDEEFCFDISVPWDWQATITGTITY